MAIRGPFLNEATQAAFVRGLFVVFVPGFAFVFILIALLAPSRPPVPTLYGCYRYELSPIVEVSAGLIAIDGQGLEPIKMSVEPGKDGYVINATPGFSFRTDRQRRIFAFRDFALGETITVSLSQSRPASLRLILDGEPVEFPKISCPRETV